jgi:hypothetical protein
LRFAVERGNCTVQFKKILRMHSYNFKQLTNLI